ncbi:MAG: ComF family protein, partial [Mycobacteriaceae bacterium]
MRTFLDLVLPLECGGCGCPATRWCPDCHQTLMVDPQLVSARVDAGVPVWSVQTYCGAIRTAIIGMKEQGRTDLCVPFGVSIARAIVQLSAWGLIATPATSLISLVPAPSRFFAARRRAGDPVTTIADVAAALLKGQVQVAPILKTSILVRDSVGLSVSQRAKNLSGNVHVNKRMLRGQCPRLGTPQLLGSSV